MSRLAEIRAAERLLAGSDYMDDAWYGESYPDVAATGLSALAHFVRFGAAMGRSPSDHFETAHYRGRMAGRAASGMNPLLHYQQQGRGDGLIRNSRIATRAVRALQEQMWGGCGAEAAARLRAMVDDGTELAHMRAEAALRLAPWLEFSGDAAAARRLLEEMAGWAPEADLTGPRRLIPLAWLCAGAGEPGRARALLEPLAQDQALPPFGRGDAGAALLLAGLETDDGQRLGRINRLYAEAGLTGLRPRDPDLPLALDNVTAGPVSPGLPDLGRVSVIIPAFNAAGSIGTALHSLLAQSYRNLEILVVDDCSTDDTAAVVGRLAALDPRITLIRAPRNGGAYPARNLGLARATGAFITTHDADDWSHPQKIEQQLAPLAADPALMASAVHWVRCTGDLRATTGWRLSSGVVHWSQSSFLLRRSAQQRLGAWDPVRAGADTEYIWRFERMFGAGALVKVQPRVPLAWARDDSGSLTRAGATHISTNHYGLRHIYREICRYWLEKPDDLLAGVPAGGGPAKQAMIPPEMLSGPQPRRRLDLHVLANLSDPVAAAGVAALIRSCGAASRPGDLSGTGTGTGTGSPAAAGPDPGGRPGPRIGVTHVPDLQAGGAFAPEVMALVELGLAELLVPGVDIDAKQVTRVGGAQSREAAA